ncbi:uncharacterized protein [Epargyreus clarus]|uniref:uncharacterized protein isoform X2 n=1 Tax=Epargyreus clarus TaxID=520877 RepID=UPI003C2E8CE2
MAEEDEIDVLGDFSFNSCFAQNNQGIPSCSDREDTVHPQWLLDSTANNWAKDGPSRKLSGNNATNKYKNEIHTAWSQTERELLKREMAKYGRNVHKISQTINTKTEAEIQALIEAEYGVQLETPHLGLAKVADHGDTPTVVQEEIVTEEAVNMSNVLNMVSTGCPTVPVPKKHYKRHQTTKTNSLLRSSIIDSGKTELIVNPSDLVYDDDLIIGSTQSIGSEVDITDIVAKNLAKQQKEKVKSMKKMGNHRRKVSRNYDRGKTKNKDMLKSPQGRQRKDSNISEEGLKSPQMQIVLGSGVSLPVSEGEQVIKIEKKKDSEAESDVEIDVDSDKETVTTTRLPKIEANPVIDEQPKPPEQTVDAVPVEKEAPIAVPLGLFEPLPKRKRKINLDGGGGCTIAHTAAGDVYQLRAEPRRERAPRPPPVHLIPCRVYNAERPAPCEVCMQVSTLLLADVHAHTSRGEVMGLLGGRLRPAAAPPAPPRLLLAAYACARAAAAHTHCDMDPVSQAAAAARLRGSGLAVCGWHHSHPRFAASPSAQDLRSQRALQRLAWRAPCLALVTSQHWPPGRAASHYRCFRVEDDDEETDPPTGYQFSVKLVADLTTDNLSKFLVELKDMVQELDTNELSVNMNTDVCPQAGLTFLEKCISSASHHMRSAGYADDDPVVKNLIQGIRDIFR